MLALRQVAIQLAITVVITLLASCSAREPQHAPMRRTASDAALPAPPSADATPRSTDACNVMSRANAEAFLALALPHDEVANNANGVSVCTYSTADAFGDHSGRVATFVFADGPAVVALGRFTPASLGDGPIELPGIGTRSMRSADSSRVEILAHGRFASVRSVGGHPTPDAAETLARALAAAL